MSLRSDFSSSTLVRLLGAWFPEPVPASGPDLAERLGLWVSAFDAIKLQAAHQALRPPAPPHATDVPEAPAARPRVAAACAPQAKLRTQVLPQLQAQVQRVRAALAHAIAQDPVALAGADPADPAYAPFQRRHAELQRHMEQMLPPLRAQARADLGQAGGRLQALARLDAVMQDMVAPREQQWLATLPALLGRRFAQLRGAAHAAQQVLPCGPGSDGASDTQDWPAAFARDWRLVLLAELDLRLEPVAGLLAALNNEANLSS